MFNQSNPRYYIMYIYILYRIYTIQPKYTWSLIEHPWRIYESTGENPYRIFGPLVLLLYYIYIYYYIPIYRIHYGVHVESTGWVYNCGGWERVYRDTGYNIILYTTCDSAINHSPDSLSVTSCPFVLKSRASNFDNTTFRALCTKHIRTPISEKRIII